METTRTGYVIVVEGHLGDHWESEHSDLELTRDPSGTTCLSGPIDQAKLHGLFRAFRDGAVTVLSVQAIARSKEE